MSPAGLDLVALGAHDRRMALEGTGPPLCYAELAARAATLRDELARAGVGPGEPVALLSRARGHDEAVALAGVLAAGAVAVPLEAAAPAARLEAVARARGLRLLVGDAGAAELAPALGLGALALDAGGLVTARPTALPGARPATAARDPTGAPLVCILHTSGSTGTPKAVPVTRAGLAAFTAFMLELTGLGPGDRVLRVAELAFDLAWFDHLATWRAGACLATLPRRALVSGRALSVAVRAAAPSVVYAVPSFFAKLAGALASEGGWPDAPRVLCFAGETYPPRALAELATLVPRARLANLFGPTETNVCTYHVVRPGELDGEHELPIGIATPYCRCTLVGGDGVALTGEDEGELVVEGPTALGGRHATGDRVARDADGLFRFRGRRDRLVKLAGHRVELGDVEAALARHPAVREAAVLAPRDARAGPTLVAFASCAPDATADARSLRAHVATLLPAYMVPERVVVMGALPRTPNGKIDYRALEG